MSVCSKNSALFTPPHTHTQPRPNSCHNGYHNILTLIESVILSYKINALSFFIQIQQQNKQEIISYTLRPTPPQFEPEALPEVS